MPELRRLAITAENPSRLADFYRQVFAMDSVGGDNGVACMSDGEFNLALVPATQAQTCGFSYLGFQMARLESIEKKLALVKYHGPVIEENGDPDIDHEIQDPDGNRIGLCKRAFDLSYQKGPVAIRHIALYTADPERLAEFYTTVLGLRIVDRTGRSSIFVSDGYINFALLYQRAEEKLGLNHFGFHVKSNAEMRARAERAGVLPGAKRPARIPFAEYRVHDPEGNGVDISEKGWKC
jgi:catechol 2,3-dioxygenase-like lactoylglutathione lyase family enzyme